MRESAEASGVHSGHLYEVRAAQAGERLVGRKRRTTGAVEFRATGLDAATRVISRLNAVVKEALERDPEVIELVCCHLEPHASLKNWPGWDKEDEQ